MLRDKLLQAFLSRCVVVQPHLTETETPHSFVAGSGVFIGGILFAALRLVTGHLGASIAAHWVFNATLLIGLSAA